MFDNDNYLRSPARLRREWGLPGLNALTRLALPLKILSLHVDISFPLG